MLYRLIGVALASPLAAKYQEPTPTCDSISFETRRSTNVRRLAGAAFNQPLTHDQWSYQDSSRPQSIKFGTAGGPYKVEKGAKYALGAVPSSFNNLMGHNADGYTVRKVITDMHNYYRKLDAPYATYMNKIVYDFHLEAYAFEWAAYLCESTNSQEFKHSPNSTSGNPAWPFRITQGENLYVTSGGVTDPASHAGDVVTKWYNEKNYYSWSTGGPNQSNAGKPTGHYTQVVRQEATKVGCAFVTNCRNNGWKTYLNCHYDYGNVGHFPYKRRSTPAICDNCPYGLNCCEDGLCTGAATTDDLKPFQKPTYIRSGWYSCDNWQRHDCLGTGSTGRLPYANGLEFQQCVCNDPSQAGSLGLIDSVKNGVFWWRNRCFQVSNSRRLGALDVIGDYLDEIAKAKERVPLEVMDGDDEEVKPWIIEDDLDEELVKEFQATIRDRVTKHGEVADGNPEDEEIRDLLMKLVMETATIQLKDNSTIPQPPPSLIGGVVPNPKRLAALTEAFRRIDDEFVEVFGHEVSAE